MTAFAIESGPRTNWFDGVNIADKSLAATLELIYLRPLLSSFPTSHKTALDIGAHRGEVTAELLSHGFRVLAVEPQEFLAEHLKTRFAAEVERGRLLVQRCAASDRVGTADLFVGSASTVSSLESEWTTTAFPNEFRSPRRVRVPLCTAGELLARRGWVTPGFLKIDVEGHELPALNGLFNHPAAGAAIAPPAVLMFEANHCFPDRAEACLDVLRSRGYRTFDLFIRVGIDPISACRAENVGGLPGIWHDAAESDFYANFIAYQDGLPVELGAGEPSEFVRQYDARKAGARR